ncbi:hypothetical protein ISF_00749 [Cordyceps fumosorosea ARSEF 2679]|uniref:Uncharacterized protein n=1 Tax=Cordyceps fumosorosea (strain ARSEF 2679) TaxID=1081104 RepID=A0A168EII5_CORFA|nr:hypothetical protein ISF_00749 [Cordyceps fumosorosea ARSEF 2679]OAA73848.1 hypothetical protein ISF_00749 [Cordyceps fumosorosea ARSEF 2679]
MTGANSWASLEARYGKLFRTLTWIAFIPALPMLLAHGFMSKHLVPVAGLIPQSLSTVAGIWLLRRKSKERSDADGEDGRGGIMDAVEGAVEEGIHEVDSLSETLTHPFLVFAFDIAIATAIMVVLVYTWRSSSNSAALSMLAAYATIPLMLSFISHVALAFAALWDGLAIHGHIKWAASRAIDSDCPNCSHGLWPERPTMPWSRFFQKKSSSSYAPVFTDGAQSYHSEDEDDHGIPGYPIEPETIDVRPKKISKKALTPVDETSALLE